MRGWRAQVQAVLRRFPAAARVAEPLRGLAARGEAGQLPVLSALAHRRHRRERENSLVVTSFDVHAHYAHLVQAVTACLEAAGVPWAQVGGPPRRGCPSLVVSSHERDRLLAAVGKLSVAKTREKRPKVSPLPEGQRGWQVRAGREAVLVWRRLVAPTGPVMAGADEGCRIELWTPVGSQGAPRRDGGTMPAGALTPPDASSAWAPDVPAELVFCGQRSPQPPHLEAMTEPIDVVYTWVDDRDPAWQQRRDQALRDHGQQPRQASATHAARFANHDELRYSLRSLANYAGWVRHIWLVTDGQRPDWLAPHPKLSVVDHRDIFDDLSVLPTFNSHAIEANLHRIDGLAQHYLYLNDDMFFGAPAFAEDYFHGNGIAKFFPAPLSIDLRGPGPDDLPIMAAAKNNRALIRRLYGREITAKMLHTPYPQLRSVLHQVQHEVPQVFAQVSASRFRSPTDVSVPASLAAYAAYAQGLALPGELRHFYLDLGAPEAPRRLRELAARRGSARAPQVICLNEVDTPAQVAASRHAQLQQTLADYFPLPSPFERSS